MKRCVYLVAVVTVLGLAGTALGSRSAALTKPRGGSAKLYSSGVFTCRNGTHSKSGLTYGTVTIKEVTADTLTVTVSLKGALPNAAYDLWLNQYKGGCPLGGPTDPDGLVTNASGNGTAHFKAPVTQGAFRFWIAATSGNEVLRSSAIQIGEPST